MINITGPFFGISGYDVHCRGIANALAKITDVRVSTQMVPNWEKMVTDKELDMLKKQPQKDEINLIITNPVNWKLNLNGKRNWVFLVWEGDTVPHCFINECLNDKIEYIFVPSQHTRLALINSYAPSIILEEKIRVIPHGVDLDKFYPKDKPSKFTFLVNKGFRNMEDRGGTQYALRAYIEEFTDKDDVELIVKINPSYGVPDLPKIMSEIANGKTNLPKINVDVSAYDYKDMVKLYNKAHVFVAPSRAESFHLGCIEAMACGLPILTTGYGGQVDFIKDKINGLFIDFDMTEVTWEIQYEGISWATPRIDDLRKKMRWFYEHPNEVKEMGEKSLELARLNTWDLTAKKIVALL